MATRLYLTADDTAVYNPASPKGAWDKTSGAVVCRLAPYRFGSGVVAQNSENNAANNYDVLCASFVSDPLHAAQTIDGTISAVIPCSEDNIDANDVLHLHVWVTQGDSGTSRGTLLSDFVDTTEFAQSSFNTQFTDISISAQTLSSVSAQAGDRIVVEAGYQAQNTHTTSRNGGILCGGRNTSDADGSQAAAGPGNAKPGWVEFSGSITFEPTYLFLLNAAEPVAPGATRGTWDVTSAGDIDYYLKRVYTGDAGTLANKSASETSAVNPTDGLCGRWISDEIAAQTIAADTFHFNFPMYEASADADCFCKIHFYVMKPDGTVRGTLLDNYVGATELGTGGIGPGPFGSTTLSSVVAVSGDRLVIEVGGRFTNVLTASKSVAINFGGGMGTAQHTTLTDTVPTTVYPNAPWIRLKNKVTFADEVPASPKLSQVIMAA